MRFIDWFSKTCNIKASWSVSHTAWYQSSMNSLWCQSKTTSLHIQPTASTALRDKASQIKLICTLQDLGFICVSRGYSNQTKVIHRSSKITSGIKRYYTFIHLCNSRRRNDDGPFDEWMDTTWVSARSREVEERLSSTSWSSSVRRNSTYRTG